MGVKNDAMAKSTDAKSIAKSDPILDRVCNRDLGRFLLFLNQFTSNLQVLTILILYTVKLEVFLLIGSNLLNHLTLKSGKLKAWKIMRVMVLITA